MDRLIRILPTQRKVVPVEPVYGEAAPIGRKDLAPLVEAMLAGDGSAREQLILGNMYLVYNIVGRFLHYWPQAANFKDDIISVGAVALINRIDEVSDPSDSKWLVYRIISKVLRDIEEFLNDNRAAVTASFRTNERRAASGEPIEVYHALPLRQDSVPVEDDGPAFVDILDSLEAIQNTDREELIDLVLAVLESKHRIDPESLTGPQAEALQQITNIVQGR